MKVALELLRAGDNQRVPAEIVPLALRHLEDFRTYWLPGLKGSTQQDRHWDWTVKWLVTNTPNFERYAIVCDQLTQGLMLIELDCHRSRVVAGASLVYIDFISIAPWNRRALSETPAYKGVGTALLCCAVARSKVYEYKGRIGLHALPNAEGFYRKLKLRDFGPDASKQNLRYFELEEYVIESSPLFQTELARGTAPEDDPLSEQRA
ncbi:hypothetical protein [Gloeobacter kilaueensis]|uniref:N-acetyltransferase domain-containing protein n=1 Tax=Gloeobacter kilaueensis (strain ATCC BAA-2537 / CCAP 1431/1 / ULC 316 / JS1) TaxID=1183438 RepID=U5QGE8_GLOK1|nr:hypothetical protein [Gloeobacter kilaueensis]AGY58042.1 hypothetical protein GKIL_1796 [Gloeobacter kilaueensis JS1]